MQQNVYPCVYAVCALVSTWIFTKITLVVHYYLLSLSSKLFKDPRYCCGDICKIRRLFVTINFKYNIWTRLKSKVFSLEILYCWYVQMSPGQMLPGQMSWWQLKSVVYVPRTLCLKFDPNRASNSWDIADMNKCPRDKCCLDK